jgi:hypothetical protein
MPERDAEHGTQLARRDAQPVERAIEVEVMHRRRAEACNASR